MLAISARDHILGLAEAGVLPGGARDGKCWYAGCIGRSYGSGDSGPLSARDSDHSDSVLCPSKSNLCCGRSPSSLDPVPESFPSITNITFQNIFIVL